MSHHKVLVVGFVGRDPEMRYLQNGTPVTSFSVATSKKYTKESGEKVEETIWWRVSAWRKLGELCNQFLSKGRLVLVEGSMQVDKETGGPRIYTRNDGTQGSSFEITAQEVRFLGGGERRERSDDGDVQAGAEEGEHIPF